MPQDEEAAISFGIGFKHAREIHNNTANTKP